MQAKSSLSQLLSFFRVIWVATLFLCASMHLMAQTAVPLPSPLPNDSLTFFKNYFVTGDYVVRGVTLRGLGSGTPSYATQPIVASSADTIPSDANVVAAFLYWITVESTTNPSAGDGFFQGYAIHGLPLTTTDGSTNSTPPCWSSGGGTGTSSGSKNSRVYRADVRPYMVSGGRFDPNASFTVSLPDSGSNGAGTPLTLGASLLIIYRNMSSPLKAVTLYNGAWTMNNANRYMFQRLANFYDASSDGTPQGKLTNIASNGQTNFVEQLQFYTDDPSGNLVTTPTSLLTNPFNSASGWGQSPPLQPVTLNAGAPRGALYIAPTTSNTDCINWGAVVMSTPVEDMDHDALLNSWEQNQGYWFPDDQTTGTRASGAQWIALEGAQANKPDVFIQFDSLNTGSTSLGGVGIPAHSHLPKYAALQQIGKAFSDAGISAHFDVGSAQSSDYSGMPYIISPLNSKAVAVNESDVNCTDQFDASGNPTSYCLYPPSTGIPGIIGWKAGLNWLKNYSWGQTSMRGRKDSFHYVLMAHALGFPQQNWSAVDGTLSLISVSGSTATVNVTGAFLPAAGDRVSISGVVSDFRLNGTYKVLSSPAPASGSFSLGLLGPVTAGTYSLSTQLFGVSGTSYNEPSLVVSTGQPRTTSGFSDLGGGDSLVTLGLWRSDNASDNQIGTSLIQAGTIMHEIGHTFVLTHGGYYPDSMLLGTNCKSNYQSVMSYLFQIRGIPTPSGPIIDYSGETLPNLNEAALVESVGIGGAGQRGTRWYGPAGFVDNAIIQQTGPGRYASTHCDGTLRPSTDTVVRLEVPTTATGVDWNQDNTIVSSPTDSQDINYNGFTDVNNFAYTDTQGILQHIDLSMRGYNDWSNLVLTQVSARANAAGYSTDVNGSQILGGGSQILGGGSQILGGGSQILGGGSEIVAGGSQILGGGSQILGGGSQILGGGSQILGGGSQILGGGAELDFDRANTVVDPPTGLTATAVTKGVKLNWTAPTFGLIRTYYVFRTDITKLPLGPNNLPVLKQVLSNSCPTSPAPCSAFATTWTDFSIKNSGVYLYFVTAALGSDSGPNAGNQSEASSMVKYPGP
jgi:hypothetical protein